MKDDFFKNKKVLVTGHTGFKGAWLSFYLYLLGSKVMGISLKPLYKFSLYEILNLRNKINSNYINILDEKRFQKKVLEFKPDIIFHLAAQALIKNSYLNPTNTWKTNLLGSINVLEIVKKLKKKCICVMITSDKCYKNLEKIKGYSENDVLGGEDPYSASKASVEIAFNSYFNSFIKKTKHKVVTARAGNVIGGGDWSSNRIIPDCVKSRIYKKKVKIRNPNATRPWQHVVEIVNGYLNLAKKLHFNKKLNGQAFNFGPRNSEIVSVRTILQYIKEDWREFQWVKTKNIVKNETTTLVLNTKKVKKELKWSTRLNVRKATNLTIEWYKKFIDNNNKKIVSELTKNQIINYHQKFKI
jgi:CDP-glucose 4,6-dehydratase